MTTYGYARTSIIGQLEKMDYKIAPFKAELEVRIADSRADLIRWVAGVSILQTSVITALLLRLVHQPV